MRPLLAYRTRRCQIDCE